VSTAHHPADRTIVRHGFVVSMDDAIGDVPDCDILIEDAERPSAGFAEEGDRA
jgi:hypothetical protein